MRRSAESWDWKATVCRGGCVMCRAFPDHVALELAHRRDLVRIEGHHIIAQRHLKKEGFEDRLWDVRNGVGLCGYHHPRHEAFRQRIPRELLPPEVAAFAAELVNDRHPDGLGWLLDKEYPLPIGAL